MLMILLGLIDCVTVVELVKVFGVIHDGLIVDCCDHLNET